MRRYHIQDRDDYKKYNKICGIITKLVSVLKRLDAQDAERIELTDQVLSKCAATCERLERRKCTRLPVQHRFLLQPAVPAGQQAHVHKGWRQAWTCAITAVSCFSRAGRDGARGTRAAASSPALHCRPCACLLKRARGAGCTAWG